MRRVMINTFRNIRRAPYQAIAAILVLTLTFFVAQFFVVLTWSSQRLTGYFETRPQVTAFFKDEIPESQLLQLKSDLEKQTFVREVKYISKQEALKIYQNQNKDDPLLLEMVTADILPASLEVSAVSADGLAQVKAVLDQTKGTEEIVYQQDVINTLQKWSSGVRIGGIVLVGFLTITSLLIITLIISMKVATKRQEIATMKLLGASSWFVVGPFVIEGAIYGLIATVISWTTLFILILYATPTVVKFLGDVPLLPLPAWFLAALFGGTSTFAWFMGMISGNLSSRRFGSK